MGLWDTHVADRNAAAKIFTQGTFHVSYCWICIPAPQHLINTTAITLTKVSGSSLLGRVVLMFEVLLSCFVVEHTRFVEGLFAFFIIRTAQRVMDVWEVLVHCVFMVHASAYPAHIAHEFSSRSSESSR